MSAVGALQAARAAGVALAVEGDRLRVTSARRPPDAVLAALVEHKAALVEMLRPWTAADWRAFRDERAGVAEHEGGMTRDAADEAAFGALVTEWLDRTMPGGPEGTCAACGAVDRPGDVVLPFGADGRRAWLHSRCWPAWHAKRTAEAVAALAALGVKSDISF